MKRYVGKYASGQRKVDEQLRREREWCNSQPLIVRKAIKAERAACAALSVSVIDGSDRETIIAFRRAYDAARAET